jgi:hypothetical protein
MDIERFEVYIYSKIDVFDKIIELIYDHDSVKVIAIKVAFSFLPVLSLYTLEKY